MLVVKTRAVLVLWLIPFIVVLGNTSHMHLPDWQTTHAAECCWSREKRQKRHTRDLGSRLTLPSTGALLAAQLHTSRWQIYSSVNLLFTFSQVLFLARSTKQRVCDPVCENQDKVSKPNSEIRKMLKKEFYYDIIFWHDLTQSILKISSLY